MYTYKMLMYVYMSVHVHYMLLREGVPVAPVQ